jgi:hypothetical protein
LSQNLNGVLSDLAGCRIVVYRPEDEKLVADVIDRVFASPPRDDARPPPRRDRSGYRATHRLVLAPEGHDDFSILGAICEVQITTLAAHLFNELEHDIIYKDHGQPATEDEGNLLDELRGLTLVSDRLVEQLFRHRMDAAQRAAVIESAEVLRFVLEREVGRPLTGDFSRLFRILEATLYSLSGEALRSLGEAGILLGRGRRDAAELALSDIDDVVCFVLGIFDQFVVELTAFAQSWSGPATPLRQAILAAATARNTVAAKGN